ncbi:glycosyltransferase family protein [Ochrovirga pacifica]|uniref:glycosyltransferase family protein n=1 Tax=Ochrovirga pacifica TaxID=1042376 RepID=UPI0002559E06|nr:hypothetical protein [Ochrovirga pacifica]
MKTCLVFGYGGLDNDVAFNVVEFYKELGFKTFYSDKLCCADLLVVLRANDEVKDIKKYEFTQVHVYDYGGWYYDEFVKAVIDLDITYIFSTSEKIKEHVVQDLGFPESQFNIAFPPVHIPLWKEKIKEIKYNTVHIGNFKPVDPKDKYKNVFDQAIHHLKAHVWGNGWEDVIEGQKYHGQADFYEVSSVYAKSKFALGFMYPFQRDTTFSGRFWHAPLNGCLLLSEPGIYTDIPGVIETDYTEGSLLEIMTKQYDREKVQEEAILYWTQQKESTKQLVLRVLPNTFDLQNGYEKKKAYIIGSIVNKLSRYAYKNGLQKKLRAMRKTIKSHK